MWRSERVVEGAEVGWVCSILTETGRVWTTPTPLSPQDSLSPAAVVTATEADVPVPHEAHLRAALVNSLTMLAADERVERRPQRHTGWGKLPSGEWAMLTGRGAVTADGVTGEARALGILYDDGGEVETPATTGNGWAAGEEFSGRIGEAWVAWRGILTGDAPLHHSLLPFAMAAGALLGVRQQGALVVTASPEVGKSAWMLCLQSMWAETDWGAEDGLGVYLPTTTKAAGRNLASWWRHLPVILDDLRDDNPASEEIVQAAIQASAGGDSGTVSGQTTGTLRRLSKLTAPVIVLGERPPRSAGAGIHSRAVHLHLGDESTSLVDTSDGGGLDEWRDHWFDGEARAAFGGLVEWVARQMKDRTNLAPGGDPASLARTAQARARVHRRELSARGKAAGLGRHGGRVATLGAFYAVGWELLLTYAAEIGQDDLLPTMDEAYTSIVDGLGAAREVAKARTVGETILAGIREALASGRVHVLDAHGCRPSWLQPSQVGWPSSRRTTTRFATDTDTAQEGTGERTTTVFDDTPPRTPVAAHLTSSGTVALLTLDACTDAYRRATGRRPAREEMVQALASVTVEGVLDGAGRATRAQHPGRQRGIPVPVALLDLDAPEVDPAEVF